MSFTVLGGSGKPGTIVAGERLDLYVNLLGRQRVAVGVVPRTPRNSLLQCRRSRSGWPSSSRNRTGTRAGPGAASAASAASAVSAGGGPRVPA
jgi:hypothetical protein